MNTEIIVLIISNIVAPIVTGIVTFLQTKKKYYTEVNTTMIDNMKESLEFYKTLSDDNKDRLNEMIEKMEKKETFSVAFTTSYCSYCAMFYNVFNDYIKDHEVTMYFIILDEETTSEQENIKIIHRYFPEFYTTPGIFYAENGKEKDYLDTYHLGISKEVIDEWVIKNQLDKEK